MRVGGAGRGEADGTSQCCDAQAGDAIVTKETGQGSADSLVKVGEETVTDPDFYRRLFGLIDALDGANIGSMESVDPSTLR